MQIEEPFHTEQPKTTFQTFQHEPTILTKKTFHSNLVFTKMCPTSVVMFTTPHLAQINSLGTQVDELLMNSTCFYLIEDHMDQYETTLTIQLDQCQVPFTTQL